MQRNYIKKKCPYCQKVISREFYYGSERELYGCPLQQCPFCNQTYVDAEWKELAREDYEANVITIPKAVLSCWPGVLLFAILFSVAIYLFVEEGMSKVFLGPLALSLLLLILFVILPTRAAYRRKEEVQKSYDAEWEASSKRLSDPHYVFSLYKSGYYMPPKYRETIKPLLMPKEALTDPTEQEYLWAKKVIEETKKSGLLTKDIADLFRISVRDVVSYYVTVVRAYDERKGPCNREPNSSLTMQETTTHKEPSNSSAMAKNTEGKPMVSYCHKCGTKVIDDSLFCHRCGAKILR